MAVYTVLDPPEVETFLASRYGLGPLQELRPIPQGIENTNYRLEVAGRPFVLTIFERESREDAEATLRLTAQLAQRGVPCPHPLMGPDGPVGALRGKPAAVVPFMEGEPAWAPTSRHLESLGRSMARLHVAGRDLRFDRQGPHLAEVLVPLARKLAHRLAPEDPDLAALLHDEADCQEKVPEDAFPSGVIHADLFLDNVLFDPARQEVCALLDFYLAGRGPWLYDIAVVLLDAGWRGRWIDGDRARAVLRGYRSVRPLVGAEYQWLPSYLRRAALRFLCLRVQRSYLEREPMAAGAAKDPREYAYKLEALREELAGPGR